MVVSFLRVGGEADCYESVVLSESALPRPLLSPERYRDNIFRTSSGERAVPVVGRPAIIGDSVWVSEVSRLRGDDAVSQRGGELK